MFGEPERRNLLQPSGKLTFGDAFNFSASTVCPVFKRNEPELKFTVLNEQIKRSFMNTNIRPLRQPPPCFANTKLKDCAVQIK
jgi:hypothetical protein